MKRVSALVLPKPVDRDTTPKEGWFAAGILAMVALAYAGTFSVPLLFDDESALRDNPSIRSLWAFDRVFDPPGQSTVAGRPFANFTFAVSYALGGLAPWAHHLVGLAVHALAALTLFGVLRRSFLTPAVKARFGEAATLLAGTIALLWAVHPLLTQTVTYLSQRTESLMALCYLLTLYAFLRGIESRGGGWHALAVATCLIGAMCKEVIVTAPLIVALYDRTFVAGTFRAAWRARRWLYVGLMSTWPVLAWLLVDVKRRGVGFDLGVSSFHYALTQCKAVVVYLQLSVWPYPLVFDRGPRVIESWGEVWPYAVVVGGLIALAGWAWKRYPRWAFLPAWFFVLLAPASSFVPVAGAPIAENRVYLPLAAVVTLVVLGVHAGVSRRVARVVWGCLIVGACGGTIARNLDYRSAERLWTDTLAKAPDNHRAHEHLAHVLARLPERRQEALARYETAQRLAPHSAAAHNHLAVFLAALPGRTDEALAHFGAALRLQPADAEIHYNLAGVLAALPGRTGEAIAHFETALRLNPDLAEAHNNLANLLAPLPERRAEVVNHYETALRLRPDYAEAHNNLGALLARLPDRRADARARFEAALRLQPDYTAAHCNLADLLAGLPDRKQEAEVHYQQALRLAPNSAVVHHNFALLLAASPERHRDALVHFQAAVRLEPDNATFHFNLGRHWENFAGRRDEALGHFRQALALQPDFAAASDAIGRLGASPR